MSYAIVLPESKDRKRRQHVYNRVDTLQEYNKIKLKF